MSRQARFVPPEAEKGRLPASHQAFDAPVEEWAEINGRTDDDVALLPGDGRLGDEQIPLAQRRALAAQVGEIQGNRQVQRMVAHLKPGQHRGALQRFASPEHEQLGSAGASQALGHILTDINIGTDDKPEYLPYGQMVALAGDYFIDLKEMHDLAASQNGRDQIRWARWKALGGTEPAVGDDIKKAVMDRYFTLAANNISHFSAGGTARNSYEEYHRQALDEAFRAGLVLVDAHGRDLWNMALTTEAFGNHYLTDMFSAGHVRTPRADIKAWYAIRFPNSINMFVTYMATRMKAFLKHKHPIANFFGFVPSEKKLEKLIREIGGPALNAFSLGDIVSLGFHNRDNVQGIQVISDVDPSGVAVPGGFHWTGLGDSNLNRSPTTRDMAVAAVATSLKDLVAVKAAGEKIRDAPSTAHIDTKAEYAQAVAKVTPFAAERFIPHADYAAGNVTMDWQWGTFNAEMRAAVDDAIKTDVADTLNDKAKDQSNADKKAALEDFAAHLKADGIKAIEAALGVPAGP
jgi:hypothetical protein